MKPEFAEQRRKEADGMKITALAPWFGGKRTLADEIVREIGEHQSYWELFCGSMAVLMVKPVCRSETVNDLHGELVNLARVIASDEYYVLRERLERTSFCEAIFHDLRTRLREKKYSDDVDRAYCFFVESWMGRNGVAGTRAGNTAFCVRYTSNGGDPATRFVSAVDSIDAWHQRIRGAWILERDAFELAERIEDKEGTVIYADPPYSIGGEHYMHTLKAEDHVRLAGLLSRFKKTRVIVSYYADPPIDALYSGWTRRELDHTSAMRRQWGTVDQHDAKAPEVLFINGPIKVESKGLFD